MSAEVAKTEQSAQPIDDGAIEVVAAQRGVATGRKHLEHAARKLEDRDVEGAAPQIVDREDALRRIVEAVGNRRGGWFVEQAQHRDCLLYTSDAADERSSVDLGGRRIIKKKNRVAHLR